VVEFAEQAAEFRLLGMIRFYADPREPVEDSKFFFAQALVDDKRVGIVGQAGGLGDNCRCVASAQVRRGEDDVRLALAGKCGEPPAQRHRLFFSQLR